MFSLIKKGIHALKPESCSLCPYGDGTHPPAKIRWDILDKDAKPLESKKRIAAGSLLMLPDQVEADRIGGPRDGVLPADLFAVRGDDSLPRVALEATVLEPPEAVPPAGLAVEFVPGTFEVSTRFSWNPRNDMGPPRIMDGWTRTTGDPSPPALRSNTRVEPWRPPVFGIWPAPLHPIDQEIEVQLRASPSAFPLQAALPVSFPERLAWTGMEIAPSFWTPAGPGVAVPEVRKHRPLYAAPPTPLPRVDHPVPAVSGVSTYPAVQLAGGLTVRDENRLRNWTAASRSPVQRAEAPMVMPYAPLMRQRFRGWQGTPKSYEWRAWDQRIPVSLPLAKSETGQQRQPALPGLVRAAAERAEIKGPARPDWRGASDIAMARLTCHTAGFGRAAVAVPEIPD